ncbi:hypothetical protein [Flavobacterium rhizosphaerae]|uniref:Uncharacterized protein n=1 Tax=Flavobacterium rhizosphaerae TaxID=3163298 RepID=A0ABW8YXL2_9FLAO
MDPFQIIVMVVIMATIAMQALQLADFKEWRSQVIEGCYLAIIIALLIYSNFFPWLNSCFL